MQHPFQRVATLPSSAEQRCIIAACGPRLVVVNRDDGKITSQWEEPAPPAAFDNGANGGERPAKKQKIDSGKQPLPNILTLTPAPDGRHVVVVTDDKCVRVFTLNAEGHFSEVSRRYMPKRPCAVEVLPDNATILVGDKFGDVYSLPLLQTADDESTAAAAKEGKDPAPQTETEKPAFKPSATNLTVHTKRNRKALEAQMKQTEFSAKKETPFFHHQLLLGHVSMLTDMIYAVREIDGKQRGYIITADRDEHIRISRGPPQAHIIEGYCLGHTEFISKLCRIPDTDLLVSGGGDDWLGIWEWPDFKLRRKFDIEHALANARSTGQQQASSDGEDVVEKRVVVSGLWTAPITDGQGRRGTVLLVALERIPALFAIQVSRLLLEHNGLPTVHPLDHPPLDVTCINGTVLVSLDSRTDGHPRIVAYKLRQEDLREKEGVQFSIDGETEGRLNCIADHVMTGEDLGDHRLDDKGIDDLVYGVANLRKRRDWDTPADGAEDAEAPAETAEGPAED